MVNESEKEQYQKIVRRVLMAMGYEKPTYSDFRLWDGLIDWRATAELLDKPAINTALCHIIDKRGDIVISEGKPVVVGRNVVANTKEEAIKILEKESLKFIGWWPSDSAPDAGDNQHEVCSNYKNKQDNLKGYHSRTIAATRDFFAGRKRTKRKTKEKLLF